MPENILVVEGEARDAALVRQALAGQPFHPSFVHEGEEALRALDTTQPKLIVLPSADLVGIIRERPALRKTPVLVLRRPFSAGDFLGEIKQLLAGSAPGRLTSNDIFGDIFDEEKPQSGARKVTKQSDDLDKLLADTLSDVMPKAKPKTQAGTTPVPSLDKKLQDTLSGLEKTARAPRPAVKPSGIQPPPAVVPSAFSPAPTDVGEKTHIAEPVFAPAPPPPIEDEEPVDGIKFGQYVLLEKIASGGMAEVWKARMRGVEGFQKIVAIKKILPHLSDNQEFIEMFIDEAKLAAQLNHANIIHIYDLGKIQNSYYIAMEYVDGQDLKTILKKADEREQPVPVEVALFVTSKIASALDFAHRKEQGLVHRDVSPQNILISEEGDIKLCDFGIAKAASKASHTQAGALKGKLQYMSPEQAWGKGIDRRSDIFALATVLFEMLTRRKLFTGDNEMSILEQVREARVTAPSQFNDEVSPEIDAIVLKALQKDPANRYQTAGEMAKDIDSLLYTFRPTPTSADLAIYMHRLGAAKPVMQQPAFVEPEPEPVTEVPQPAPVAAVATAASVPPMPAWDARPAAAHAPVITPFPEKKRSAAVPIAIAAVIAIAAIGGFFFMRSRSTAATPPAVVQTKPVAQPPAAAPASATVATAATQTLAPAPLTATTLATTTQASLDPAKVNEEVQRRLATERAKLEQRSRVQQPPAQPLPQVAQQRPAAQPVVQRPAPAPVQPQPVAPPPAVAESRPAPAPITPQPATETRAPAPQPAAETVHVGDLVDDFDTAPHMVNRANVAYPPMARMEKVQGTVLVSALISETGAVLQTKLLKGVSRNVGLNEAAEQIVRRSTFTPPMKNGVRVKAWTTVPIDFKL